MNPNSPYSTLILIALMVLAFYVLIIRPNKKRQQAQIATMNSLTPGTRVLLTSGLFGTLVEVGAKQAVLELSPGVHLTVLKQAIARQVREGDEDSFEDDDTAGDEQASARGFDSVSGGDQPEADHHLNDPRGSQTNHTLDSSYGQATAADSLQSDHSNGASAYRPGSSGAGRTSDPQPGTNTNPTKD